MKKMSRPHERVCHCCQMAWPAARHVDRKRAARSALAWARPRDAPRRPLSGSPKKRLPARHYALAVAELRGNLCSWSLRLTHTVLGRLSLWGFGFVGVLKIFYAARHCQGLDRHDLCGWPSHLAAMTHTLKRLRHLLYTSTSALERRPRIRKAPCC